MTEKMASHFKEVYVTEVSTPMIWRLQSKDYKYIFFINSLISFAYFRVNSFEV